MFRPTSRSSGMDVPLDEERLTGAEDVGQGGVVVQVADRLLALPDPEPVLVEREGPTGVALVAGVAAVEEGGAVHPDRRQHGRDGREVRIRSGASEYGVRSTSGRTYDRAAETLPQQDQQGLDAVPPGQLLPRLPAACLVADRDLVRSEARSQNLAGDLGLHPESVRTSRQRAVHRAASA